MAITRLNPIGQDIQSLSGARAFGQGANKYKMAGDLAKTQGQTERQGRDIAYRERELEFSNKLKEQQEDIKMAQQYAREDVKLLEENYQRRWSEALRQLQEARDDAAEALGQGLTNENRDAIIGTVFSGIGGILQSGLQASEGKTGLAGEWKDRRLAREAAQNALPVHKGQQVQLGVSPLSADYLRSGFENALNRYGSDNIYGGQPLPSPTTEEEISQRLADYERTPFLQYEGNNVYLGTKLPPIETPVPARKPASYKERNIQESVEELLPGQGGKITLNNIFNNFMSTL